MRKLLFTIILLTSTICCKAQTPLTTVATEDSTLKDTLRVRIIYMDTTTSTVKFTVGYVIRKVQAFMPMGQSFHPIMATYKVLDNTFAILPATRYGVIVPLTKGKY